jgi:hypothetical protein
VESEVESFVGDLLLKMIKRVPFFCVFFFCFLVWIFWVAFGSELFSVRHYLLLLLYLLGNGNRF